MQMAKDKEVKAQVKLRFFAANGAKMIASRSMSVTAKKTGLTFKTLESLLAPVTADGGKGGKVSLFLRCLVVAVNDTRYNIKARRNINQMCRIGRRNPPSSWCFESRPGKRYFLSSRGFILATRRSLCFKEEVRRYL